MGPPGAQAHLVVARPVQALGCWPGALRARTLRARCGHTRAASSSLTWKPQSSSKWQVTPSLRCARHVTLTPRRRAGGGLQRGGERLKLRVHSTATTVPGSRAADIVTAWMQLSPSHEKPSGYNFARDKVNKIFYGPSSLRYVFGRQITTGHFTA